VLRAHCCVLNSRMIWGRCLVGLVIKLCCGCTAQKRSNQPCNKKRGSTVPQIAAAVPRAVCRVLACRLRSCGSAQDASPNSHHTFTLHYYIISSWLRKRSLYPSSIKPSSAYPSQYLPLPTNIKTLTDPPLTAPHLTVKLTLMFIAASSVARYLNTNGIPTRSMYFPLPSQSRQTTLALEGPCTPATMPANAAPLTAWGLVSGERMEPHLRRDHRGGVVEGGGLSAWVVVGGLVILGSVTETCCIAWAESSQFHPPTPTPTPTPKSLTWCTRPWCGSRCTHAAGRAAGRPPRAPAESPAPSRQTGCRPPACGP